MRNVRQTKKGQAKEDYGIDPKERTKGFEVFVDWLNRRSLGEKQTALVLLELLSKQHLLPDGNLGHKLHKQWRQEVLNTVSDAQDTPTPEDENFCRGFLTAFLTVSE